jgi:hypothetical protein
MHRSDHRRLADRSEQARAEQPPRQHELPRRAVGEGGRPNRWTLAASGSIVLARAAFEAATKEWPHERFTLRQGIMTIREYPERPPGR